MDAVKLYKASTLLMKFTSEATLDDVFSSTVDDEFLSDIEVKVRGKSFPCHKIILAARSSYFNDRLRRDAKLAVMVEEDGNSDAFDLIRRYIYTGTVAHDQADVELIANVLLLSLKYNLDELANFMTGQMRERIAAPNAVTVFRLMSDMKMNSMAEECLEFMKSHVEDCLQSGSYIDLKLNHLVHLLKTVNVGAETQLTVIGKWSKMHRNVHVAKLFDMLDGEDDKKAESAKQYILLKGQNESQIAIVILDADTLDHVSTRDETTTIPECQIAVCNKMLYIIDTGEGEIKSTPVSALLKSKSIKWDKCAGFKSSEWIRGNVAVTGSLIYFMDRTHLWKFDTDANIATKLCESEVEDDFYHLVELNGLIYCYKDNRFQFTDGTTGWTPVLGQYPYSCSLIKTRDSVCLVGGERRPGASLSSVLRYDTTSTLWTKDNSINQVRSRAATVSLDGGRELLVGGDDCALWVDTIELFDEQTKEWSFIKYKVKFENPQAVAFYA